MLDACEKLLNIMTVLKDYNPILQRVLYDGNDNGNVIIKYSFLLSNGYTLITDGLSVESSDVIDLNKIEKSLDLKIYP